jgi:hypothetical protein
MAAVIALRPKDDRGVEIIVELEARTEMNPMEVIEDDRRGRWCRRLRSDARQDRRGLE